MNWAKISGSAARLPSSPENGDYISGYMEPRELLDQLKEFQVAKR